MTKINNTLRPRPRSTVEGRTGPGSLALAILPPREHHHTSFDDDTSFEALVPYDEDHWSNDPATTFVLPKFPELERVSTPSDKFSSVPFSVLIQSLLDLDSEGQDGGDGGSAAAAAAGTPLSESTPRPFQPRKIPVKIIHSSTSGDSKLPPMDVEEGWVLGLPFQPRKTPVKIIHSTKLPPMEVEEGWVLPQPSKTRFRPAKRSGSGTGTSHFSYLKPRKTDFAEKDA
jgi:hypothetical protein